MKGEEVGALLENYGPFQRRLFVLLTFPLIMKGYQSMTVVITFASPPHRCQIPGLVNDTFAIQSEAHRMLLNLSIPVTSSDGDVVYSKCDVYKDRDVEHVNRTLYDDTQPCDRWVYDATEFDNTIVTQFDMVCEDKGFRANYNMMMMLGLLVGSPVSGFLCDRFGRKKIFYITMMISIALSVISAFPVVPELLLLYKFLLGAVGMACYLALYVLCLEFMGPSQRSLSGTLMMVLWIIGPFLVGALSFVIRDWRWIQVLSGAPFVFCLSYWWLIPESPRWLLSKGREKEARAIILKVARINKLTLTPDSNLHDDTVQMGDVTLTSYSAREEEKDGEKGEQTEDRETEMEKDGEAETKTDGESRTDKARSTDEDGKTERDQEEAETDRTTETDKEKRTEINNERETETDKRDETDTERQTEKETETKTDTDKEKGTETNIETETDKGRGESVDKEKGEEENGERTKDSPLMLLKYPTLIARIGIIMFNWSAVSMTYYGLSLNVSNLAGSVRVNFLLSNTVELVGYSASWCLLDRLGRKLTHCGAMLLSGTSCLLCIFPLALAGSELQWVTTSLAMLGKLGISAAFNTVYLMSGELLPTTIRNMAMGACSTVARVASALAPYIVDMALYIEGAWGPALPLTVFGSVAMAAGLMALCLPETLHRILPDTIVQAASFTKHNPEVKENAENGRTKTPNHV